MTTAASAATAQLPPSQEPAANNAQPRFARVVAVQPITRSSTTSSPRQVCRDEQVAVPETYKDQHQVGGAAAGAFAGHEIQKKHQENNATRTETRNVCHTVTDKTTSTKTVGYDVTYTLNGQAGHIRMDRNPGIGTGLPVRNGVVVASGKQAGNYYQ